MDALVVLEPCHVERLATVPLREPLWEADDNTEDNVTGAEWRGHRRVVRGVAEYEGRDAEEHIDYRSRNEGITCDEAEVVIDGVEEIAEGPKKQEDRDVQEHVCPVHEPPHLESAKAMK